MVQNAAASLDTGARKCKRMTLFLRELHWLPIRRWIILKTAVLVWHTSVSMVRLHSICNRTVSQRQRVLVIVTCVLHRRDIWSSPERGRNTATAASPFQDLASGTVFTLPVELRASDISVTVFRNRLKTHLFDTT